MTPLPFVLALFAAQPADAPGTDSRMTTGQLYDDCARYVARGDRSLDASEDGAVTCAAVLGGHLASNAVAEVLADTAEAGSHPRSFCPPENVTRAEEGSGAPLARAFIAYVDRNPASRNLDYAEVFQRALTEKWPCPH